MEITAGEAAAVVVLALVRGPVPDEAAVIILTLGLGEVFDEAAVGVRVEAGVED